MNYIAHRINTVKELEEIPPEYGVEIDLRDSGDGIILQHDPFKKGENFEDYLLGYHHGTMILNIKSEGIEDRVLGLVKKFGVKSYFFLDSSFPMIYRLIKKGEENIALRFSEFEGLDTIMSLAHKARWVWVDCFTKLPIDIKNYSQLKKAGFKLCLVSPDLQARSEDIEKYKISLTKANMVFDAICAKFQNIPRWSG